jgi:PilZ domain-containing protein
MQPLGEHTDSFDSPEGEEPIRIWIDNGEGSIARGLVEVLSESGAVVRLVGTAPIASGDDVVVRIAVNRRSPTLGGAARVSRVRTDEDAWECELEWTHVGLEREQLASLVASLG